MNKYKLVNENRANDFMTELKELLQGNINELNKIEADIKDVFFGKIPTDFEDTIIEWEKEHINQKWTKLKERNFFNFVGKSKRSVFGSLFESNSSNTQHSYEDFAKLCSKFESLTFQINSLSKQIIHIEQYKSEEPNSDLNDFLLDDTTTFNEAIFCLLGLNPKSLYKLNIHPLNNIVDLANVDDEFRLLIVGLLCTVEFRRLNKAPSQINNKPFIFYDKVYTNRLIDWSIEKQFLEEITSNVGEKEFDIFMKDIETGIQNGRLRIYKETLPNYLYDSDTPTSIRELTTATDGIKTYEYYESIKNWVGGISAETVRKDIGELIKSSWWKKQPKELQEKIKK